MAGGAAARVRRPQPGVRRRGGAARVVPRPRRRGVAAYETRRRRMAIPPPSTRSAPPTRRTTVPVSRAPLSGSAAPPEPELTLFGGVVYTGVTSMVAGGNGTTVTGVGITVTG